MEELEETICLKEQKKLAMCEENTSRDGSLSVNEPGKSKTNGSGSVGKEINPPQKPNDEKNYKAPAKQLSVRIIYYMLYSILRT